VNTAGYARRTIDFAAVKPESSLSAGNGVEDRTSQTLAFTPRPANSDASRAAPCEASVRRT